MGKKAKTKAGKVKATSRKVDKATLPGPPKAIEEEVRTHINLPLLHGGGTLLLNKSSLILATVDWIEKVTR